MPTGYTIGTWFSDGGASLGNLTIANYDVVLVTASSSIAGGYTWGPAITVHSPPTHPDPYPAAAPWGGGGGRRPPWGCGHPPPLHSRRASCRLAAGW